MPEGQYPDIFKRLHTSGIPCEEMYRTFNCGWGFVIATSKPEIVVEKTGGTVLGKLVDGTGRVKVKSGFSGEVVIY